MARTSPCSPPVRMPNTSRSSARFPTSMKPVGGRLVIPSTPCDEGAYWLIGRHIAKLQPARRWVEYSKETVGRPVAALWPGLLGQGRVVVLSWRSLQTTSAGSPTRPIGRKRRCRSDWRESRRPRTRVGWHAIIHCERHHHDLTVALGLRGWKSQASGIPVPQKATATPRAVPRQAGAFSSRSVPSPRAPSFPLGDDTLY